MEQPKSLGDLEQQVMEFLWRNGPSTAEVVRAAVSKDRSLSDSTIRTVLRRLEAKQFVKHEINGRQFIYSSSREPRKVAAEAVRSALRNFCRGSLEELLTGMVDHRVIDSSELRRLAEKIETLEKSKTTKIARNGRKS